MQVELKRKTAVYLHVVSTFYAIRNISKMFVSILKHVEVKHHMLFVVVLGI